MTSANSGLLTSGANAERSATNPLSFIVELHSAVLRAETSGEFLQFVLVEPNTRRSTFIPKRDGVFMLLLTSVTVSAPPSLGECRPSSLIAAHNSRSREDDTNALIIVASERWIQQNHKVVHLVSSSR